ncbi:MAG: YgfZ/GcvT domain-containing protein [Janthinobacterium lividum]
MTILSSTVQAVAGDIANAIPSGGGFAQLNQLGTIDAIGADALAFLHAQLTNDVEHLDDKSVRRGGLCSPKGRLLATFIYWRIEGGVRLLLSADLVPAIVKRLSMFVLRSKVKLTDSSANLSIVGFAGTAETLSSALTKLLGAAPERTMQTSGDLLRLDPVDDLARFLWIAPRDIAAAHSNTLAGALSRLDAERWDWLAIRAGEARVSAATQDRFVPQMINFELIDGVSFSKGCYPGQEVVARSQYRGTVKRRAQIVSLDPGQAERPQAGDDVFDAATPNEACGTIINVAATPGGGVDCLAELKLAALESGGSLHWRQIDGPLLHLQALPYPVFAPE